MPEKRSFAYAQDDSSAERIPRSARNDNDVSPLPLSGQQKNQNTNRAVAASSGNGPVSLPAQIKVPSNWIRSFCMVDTLKTLMWNTTHFTLSKILFNHKKCQSRWKTGSIFLERMCTNEEWLSWQLHYNGAENCVLSQEGWIYTRSAGRTNRNVSKLFSTGGGAIYCSWN